MLREDEFRKRNTSEEQFSKDSLINVARDIGASHILYVDVDRPATQWVKITAQCLDLTGGDPVELVLAEDLSVKGVVFRSGPSMR